MKKLFIFILLMAHSICWSTDISNKNYLSKPTGEYGIAFRDFHWINQNLCPDPMFTGKNGSDYSQNNPQHCREIIARVYYPSLTNKTSQYYHPFIAAQKEILTQIPEITKHEIAQLNQLQSYSYANARPITDKIFPVILFSPGYGCSIQTYENFITELVSHGYIVIGINSPFISGDIELPNKHIIKTSPQMNINEILKNILPIQAGDFSFILKQIYKEHADNLIFSAMDLKHIAAFGHSLGALVVDNFVQTHPKWLQAAVTLDVGGNSTIKKANLPIMDVVSASFIRMVPVEIELGSDGYEVGLTPSSNNYHYSFHMNLSDRSTLQYLPAYRKVADYLAKIVKAGCDIKFLSHEPTKEEISAFDKTTYVLIEKDKKWILSYYEAQTKIDDLDTSMIKNLDIELNKLPPVPPEQLTEAEKEPIKQIVKYIFIYNHTQLGNGNGWKITNSINTYLVQFFNMYLKGKENLALKTCNSLTDDTLIRCG